MAICHLRTRVGSAARGQSAAAKSDYVTREGKYGRDFEEVEHIGDGNMPQWAKDDPREYWKAADKHERANGRLFVEVQVALPVELDREQRRELAKTFARRLTDGEQLPYTVAIHRGLSRKPDTPDNPHVHIVLSERSNDGQARSAETWFRRANRKNPERGGARKVSHLQAREWPESIRQGWAAECNRALQRAGRPERIDPRTLAEQSREALKRGDLEQAEALNRAPEPKRGAGDAIQRRYERGEAPEPSRAVAAWERTRAANARWRQECQQQNQKAGRVRAALDVAERMIPASQEERAIGRAVGEALVRRMAQAGRSVVERPGPSSSSPQQEPTLWERYQQRWPNDHEGGDRERVQTISGQSEAEGRDTVEVLLREHQRVSNLWDAASKGGDRQIALEGEAQRAENALYERSCKLPSDERHEYEKLAEERSGPQLSR